MSRIDLRVPFADKDQAKRLGARWDSAAKLWFVPEDRDPAPFDRWLPPEGKVNIRAPDYFIAAATRSCWRCEATSKVHGFILPPDYETLYVHEDPPEECWEPGYEPTLVCYLDYLAPAVAARILAETPCYRMAFSAITRSYYWMNFCEYCSAQLGDHESYSEPGQGFLAFTIEQAKRISLAHVAEPFEASCGSYSIGVVLYHKMRRR